MNALAIVSERLGSFIQMTHEFACKEVDTGKLYDASVFTFDGTADIISLQSDVDEYTTEQEKFLINQDTNISLEIRRYY